MTTALNPSAISNPFYLNPNEVMDKIKANAEKDWPDDYNTQFLDSLYSLLNEPIRALPSSHTEHEFNSLKSTMKKIAEALILKELDKHFRENKLFLPRCLAPLNMKERFNIWTSPLYFSTNYFLREIDSITSENKRTMPHANVSKNFADRVQQFAEETHLEYLPQISNSHNFIHAITNLTAFLNGVGYKITEEFRGRVVPTVIENLEDLRTDGDLKAVSSDDVPLDEFFTEVLRKGYGLSENQISHVEQQATTLSL